MRSKFIPAFLFFLGSMVLRAPAGTLSIDGVSVGPVLKWWGGDARGVVVNDVSPGKHLANVSYDPVVVEAPLPLAAPLVSWINDFASGKHTMKSLVLVEIEPSGRTTPMTTTLEASNVYLTRVRFPAGDAASRTPAVVVLEFAVGQARLVVGPGQSGTATPARTTGSSHYFRVSVDGLDASRVSKLDSLEITLASVAGHLGDSRLAGAPTGLPVFSNLTLTLPESAAAGWRTWLTDFALNANGGEKGGSLEFLNTVQTSAVFRLQFAQMGIVRVTRQPSWTDAASTVQAELYFEQLSIVAAPATATQTSQTQPATTPADPAATQPAATPPASDSTPTPTTAPTSATDLPILGTRVPVAVANTGVTQIRPLNTTLPQTTTIALAQPAPSSSTVTPAQAASANPADQGSRDPMEFPRIGGLTRLTFSGSMQKDYVQESATYASADDLRSVVDTVVKTAKAAGWQQTSLSESGNKTDGRLVNAEWSKGSIRAQLSITDRKPSGTAITLWVAGVKSGG